MTRKYLNSKKQWIDTHVLGKPEKKKCLCDCIWRDLVPFDVIDYIDFQSLVDFKERTVGQYDIDNPEDFRILKTLSIDDKRYDLIISVLDPKEDSRKTSYQFFIIFTEPVNNVPFNYKRSVKIVIPYDYKNKKLCDEISTAMVSDSLEKDENFSKVISKLFDDLDFPTIDTYISELLRNILFNYLCLIKIRKINETDKGYSVLPHDGKYYIYKDGNKDCVVCVPNQNDANIVIERLIGKGKRGKNAKITLKRKTIYVVYLNPSESFVSPENPQIKVLSVEDFLNEMGENRDDSELSKLESQINYLKNLRCADDANICKPISYTQNKEIIEEVKFLFSYTEEIFAVKRSSVVTKSIYQKEFCRIIKDDEIYDNGQFEQWNDIIITKRVPYEILKGSSLCYYYKDKRTSQIIKVDEKKYAIRQTIIVPETEDTACKIYESLFKECRDFVSGTKDNLVQWNENNWFNYLCSVNLMYAYKKQHQDMIIPIDLREVYNCLSEFKKRLMKFRYSDNHLLISIEVEHRKYQFVFEGSEKDLKYLKESKGLQQGKLVGINLFSIAPILYEYSCYLLQKTT